MKQYGKIAMLLLLALVTTGLSAQCPMCRMTAESNMQNGGTAGAGLNAGILYMLVAPYFIVGGIAYWWWKNKRKPEDTDTQEQEWITAEDKPNWN